MLLKLRLAKGKLTKFLRGHKTVKFVVFFFKVSLLAPTRQPSLSRSGGSMSASWDWQLHRGHSLEERPRMGRWVQGEASAQGGVFPVKPPRKLFAS